MTTALITSNHLAFTSTGLKPDSHPITEEEWLQAGYDFRQYCNTNDATEGLLWGAWLNFGKRKFGEAYSQGYDLVLSPDPDDRRSHYATKTIWQYEYTSEHIPPYLWGLAGVSHRHYFDAATRLKDKTELCEHLIKVSQLGLSVRAALKLLPPSERKQTSRPASYPDDINHELTVENHKLRNELDVHRALIDEAESSIEQARGILVDVVDELSVEQAKRVQQAIDCLTPVVVRSEFVELVGQAIDLYDRGEITAMVDVMERLRILRKEMLNQSVVIENEPAEQATSARADDTIIVNGVPEFRPDWLEEVYG